MTVSTPSGVMTEGISQQYSCSAVLQLGQVTPRTTLLLMVRLLFSGPMPGGRARTWPDGAATSPAVSNARTTRNLFMDSM
jgi:hypothetical protein